MNGHPKYKEILDRMWELHDSKARSYGSSEDPLANLRNGERFGMPAWKRCLVEADSAFYRTQNYCNGRNGDDESFVNALMDTAAFSMLALLFFEERKEKLKEARERARAEMKSIWNKGMQSDDRNITCVAEDEEVDTPVSLGLTSFDEKPSPPKSNGVAMADALFTGVFGMKRVDPGYRKPSEEVGARISEVLEKAK